MGKIPNYAILSLLRRLNKAEVYPALDFLTKLWNGDFF